jgi:ATP-dependent DNA helicase RecG
MHYDWSSQPSSLRAEDTRPEAFSIARRFLRNAGDERSAELAEVPVADLLRRFGLVTTDGQLTNGGAVLLVGRPEPALDYIRRPRAGADSDARVREGGRSLLEELDEVFTTLRAYNPETHLEQGLVISRLRALPERAAREAIVNGVAHREWTDPAPTVVEHIGATLRITSPGGFFGGVRSDNIINHPSSSRNRALTTALATLRIAEQQGIGVDRMYSDMLRLGHPEPSIEEQDGARVLAVLAGDRPDVAWIRWLAQIDPPVVDDLRLLMSLQRLTHQWWVDAHDLAPHLQVTNTEAEQVVHHLRDLRLAGSAVTYDVQGVPAGRATIVLSISRAAWQALVRLSREARTPRPGPSRDAVALSYARHAGRISTTEFGSIIGASPTNVGGVLRRLEAEGHVEPSWPSRRGAGFYYRFVGPIDES